MTTTPSPTFAYKFSMRSASGELLCMFEVSGSYNSVKRTRKAIATSHAAAYPGLTLSKVKRA